MTHQLQCHQQWPLKDENNIELILPSELYWKYIYPYTAVDDRIIINKHTKSTQFYAGHRVEINHAFLDKHDKLAFVDSLSQHNPICYIIELSDQEVSTLKQVTGTSSIILKDEAIVLLCRIRRSWDMYLSSVSSPSHRLHACLQMFYGDDCPDIWPLLFCGEGRVDDVVQLHAMMDSESINGQIDYREPLVYTPIVPTTLGIWLDEYLSSAFHDMQCMIVSDTTYQLKCIARALLGADNVHVKPFFEPLDHCPDTFYAHADFKHGMSMVGCMKRCAYKWFVEQYDSRGVGARIRELNWVIDRMVKLNTAKKKKHPICFGRAILDSVAAMFGWRKARSVR